MRCRGSLPLLTVSIVVEITQEYQQPLLVVLQDRRDRRWFVRVGDEYLEERRNNPVSSTAAS